MKYQVEDYRAAGRSVKEKLELETEPVAIKFIKNLSEIPDDFIRPVRDTGKMWALCQGIDAARREGKYVALTAEDNPCTPATVGHGWVKVSILDFLKSQTTNKWQKNLLSVLKHNHARMRMGGFMANWPWSRLLGRKGMMVAPLSKTPFIPDTVQVYGYPLQMMHASHAFCYEGKYVPKASINGFGEACFAAGSFPSISKKPIFVLLGGGDRAFGGTKKYETAIGMPGFLVFYLDEYLYKTGGDDFDLKELCTNPLAEVTVDSFPGWRDVYEVMKKKNSF
jgi:uncharacterized protein (DUF169 family)